MSFWKRAFQIKKRSVVTRERNGIIEPGVKSDSPVLDVTVSGTGLGDDVLGITVPKAIHRDAFVAPDDPKKTRLAHERYQPKRSLLTLPTEIIGLVLDHCDTVTTLSLRYSSRQLRDIIPPILSSPLEKNLFWRLLKKDRFFELCLLEEAGRRILSSDVALCSNCLEAHSIDLFSPAQQAAPSRRRVCVGIDRQLMICEHSSIDFNKVRIAAARLPGQLACTGQQHGGMPISGPWLDVVWVQTTGSNLTLRSQRYIDHWETGATPTIARLKASVKKHIKDVQICPHTRGHDITTAPWFTDKNGPFVDLEGHSFICRNIDCHTTVVFLYRYGANAQAGTLAVKYLVMEARRNLGPLRVPTDRQWLAQVGHDVPPAKRANANRGSRDDSRRVHLTLFEAV